MLKRVPVVWISLGTIQAEQEAAIYRSVSCGIRLRKRGLIVIQHLSFLGVGSDKAQGRAIFKGVFADGDGVLAVDQNTLQLAATVEGLRADALDAFRSPDPLLLAALRERAVCNGNQSACLIDRSDCFAQRSIKGRKIRRNRN